MQKLSFITIDTAHQVARVEGMARDFATIARKSDRHKVQIFGYNSHGVWEALEVLETSGRVEAKREIKDAFKHYTNLGLLS